MSSSMYACIFTWVCVLGGGARGGQRLKLGAFLYHSMLNLELTNLSRPVRPPALGICPTLPAQSEGCRCMPSGLAFYTWCLCSKHFADWAVSPAPDPWLSQHLTSLNQKRVCPGCYELSCRGIPEGNMLSRCSGRLDRCMPCGHGGGSR